MPNSQDEIQRHWLARAILLVCARKHGSVHALARYLGVEENKVIDWVGGIANPPREIVQKAVEPFLQKNEKR